MGIFSSVFFPSVVCDPVLSGLSHDFCFTSPTRHTTHRTFLKNASHSGLLNLAQCLFLDLSIDNSHGIASSSPPANARPPCSSELSAYCYPPWQAVSAVARSTIEESIL